MKFMRQIMDAKSAVNALSDVLVPNDLANINELTYYIVYSSGVSAGAVQPEESHLVGYTGVWAPIGSPITFVDGGIKTVKATGVGHVGRCRISTGLTGGTVSIWAMGR